MSVIYIADDNKTNRYYLEKVMLKEGYEVLSFKDGRELVEGVKKRCPDLIITDINMPVKDGFTAIGEIREIAGNILLPVIATSATYQDIQSKITGYELGSNEYLTLPFEESELLAKIRYLLNVKELHEQLIEREQKLMSIFKAIKDNIFEIDYDGVFLFIAPSSEEFLYKPSNQLIGKNLYDIFTKDMADMFLNFIRECLDKKKTISLEYKLDINGKLRCFEGRATPKTEKVALFIAKNITKYKDALQELEDNRIHLEEIVNMRTAKLEEQNEQLMDMNKVFVGREFRIKELRDKVKNLEKQIQDLNE